MCENVWGCEWWWVVVVVVLGGVVGGIGGGGNVIVKRPALSLCAIEIGALEFIIIIQNYALETLRCASTVRYTITYTLPVGLAVRLHVHQNLKAEY